MKHRGRPAGLYYISRPAGRIPAILPARLWAARATSGRGVRLGASSGLHTRRGTVLYRRIDRGRCELSIDARLDLQLVEFSEICDFE